MSDKIERSEFGYWVRPDGLAIPMASADAHGQWIRDGHVLGREFDGPDEAFRHAVLNGWIAVGMAPEGAGCRITVRKEAVTKRAALTLRRMVSQIGFLKDEVQVEKVSGSDGLAEHASGSGQYIANLILNGAWDDETYLDPMNEVELLADTVNRIVFKGALKTWGAAAIGSGSLPEIDRLMAELRTIEPIKRRMYNLAYGWSSNGYEASRRGDLEFLHGTLSSVRQGMLKGIGEIEDALSRASAALYGIPCPLPVERPEGWEPVPHLLPGEAPLAAMTRLAQFREEAVERIRTTSGPIDAAPEQIKLAMRKAEGVIAVLQSLHTQLVRRYFQRLDAEVLKDGGRDPKTLYNLMSYYLCHECGRTTYTKVDLGPIKEHVSAIREYIATSEPEPPSAPGR